MLAMWGLKDRAAYFYTPADIAAGKAADGQAIRLGGMVEKGSVERAARRRHHPLRSSPTARRGRRSPFAASSRTCSAKASGAVAEGRMQRGTFVADTILAKHDERYMPPELGNLAAEHKAGKTLRAMIAEAGLAALWLAAGLAASPARCSDDPWRCAAGSTSRAACAPSRSSRAR